MLHFLKSPTDNLVWPNQQQPRQGQMHKQTKRQPQHDGGPEGWLILSQNVGILLNW